MNGRRFALNSHRTARQVHAANRRRRWRPAVEPLEPRLLMADTRPNFVVINTDDQRFDTLAYMPITLSELADSGTTFDNSFVTSAICCPSRASLLTGQYAHNTGVLFNEPPLGGFEEFNDTSTLATWLQDAGYRTGLVGKYLNSYDQFSLYNADPQNTYVAPGWDEWQAFIGASYFNFSMSNNGVSELFTGGQNYSTDVLANKGASFISAAESNDEQPFFLYFTPHAPHTPANPAPRHNGMFNNIAPFRPPSFNEPDVSDKPLWLQNLPQLTAAEITENDELRKNQLESLQAVDEAVGQLMNTLRANGELERTVVIFTSDNGQVWGEHRWTTKVVAYEESIRVPLLIRDGRNPVQQTATAMALNIDLAPTIAAMAGVTPAHAVDGQSLVPVLNNPATAGRDDFLIEHFRADQVGRHFGLRTTQWKYVEYPNGNRELYDLATDPYELTSRHADPSLAPLIAQFSARMVQLKSQDTLGPLMQGLTAPSRIVAGPMTVSATVNDATRGNSQVRTSEYFIDVLGPIATGVVMLPQDRTWGGTSEVTTAAIDAATIAALSPGTHTIFVRGRDVGGNWGPAVSTTFIKSLLGDMNGDNVTDNFDIQPMEIALANPTSYLGLYPVVDYQDRGDINRDATFDNFDIQPLEEMLVEVSGASSLASQLPPAPLAAQGTPADATTLATGNADTAAADFAVRLRMGLPRTAGGDLGGRTPERAAFHDPTPPPSATNLLLPAAPSGLRSAELAVWEEIGRLKVLRSRQARSNAAGGFLQPLVGAD